MLRTISYYKNHLNNQLDVCVQLYIRESCQGITNSDVLMFTCTLQLLNSVFFFVLFLIGAGGILNKFTSVSEV